ncbi:hypothetical protein [Rhodococcus sovatensis]|uniref:DUF4352 domain-containing protein n=1 Tax=Rhodococcus sovatensis TaxID=1805840 RepID=A0ABZ2PNF5_9NOCA
MKYLLIIVALLMTVGCSQSEPKAIAVIETSVTPPEPVQVDTLIYKFIEAERMDRVESLQPRGYFVRARYRVTNTGDPIWVSYQYSQLETDSATYEQDNIAGYEVEGTAMRFMPQNDWNEVDVYFDIPNDEQARQILIKNGKDSLPAKFDIDLT